MLAMPATSVSLAQTESDFQRLEQAKAALEEAQSALENAQDTLEQAQPTVTLPSPETVAAQSRSSIPTTPTRANNRLYKWVDVDGNVSYQDSPPPKDVRVLNSDVLKSEEQDGKPVKELRAASSPAPIMDGSTPVMVYTADNCKPCQSVVLFLTQKQVPFIERDIRNDRKARDRLSKLSKQITVPSLFIGDRIIQGNVKPVITRALEESGYLKPQR